MRAATYILPAALGDSEPATCSVFYFGVGRGGDTQNNLTRWIRQFAKQDQNSAQTRTQTIGKIPVSLLSLQGTFLSSVRPMSPQKIKKPNFKLWGAIVQGPQGKVFFKCVGPKNTMKASASELENLLRSIQPSNTTAN